MIVGYARVSMDGQTLAAQQSALAAAGCDNDELMEKLLSISRAASTLVTQQLPELPQGGKMSKRQTLEEWVQQRAMTEAVRQAKEVKEQLHIEGRYWWRCEPKEIATRADAIIAANREAAIAQAVERLSAGMKGGNRRTEQKPSRALRSVLATNGTGECTVNGYE